MLRSLAASSSAVRLSPRGGMAARLPATSASFATSALQRQATPAPAPPKMVKLTINGKEIEVEQGTALIQACEKAGAQIPRFCYHERLMVAGNCRMCLVESKGAPKPLASCASMRSRCQSTPAVELRCRGALLCGDARTSTVPDDPADPEAAALEADRAATRSGIAASIVCAAVVGLMPMSGR